MDEKRRIHPGVFQLKRDLDRGKISRRDFLRFSALLGMSTVAASQLGGLAWPARAFGQAVQRGGKVRVSGPVHKVTHPAQFSWITPTNQLRQVAEYLTFTDAENITHPYLLENWKAGIYKKLAVDDQKVHDFK